jgi:serine/threonine protein kinase
MTTATLPPSMDRRFRLERRLGEGASGQSLLVTDLGTGRQAVLKLAHDRADDNALAAFQREKQAQSRLRHRGVATIWETGVTEEGHPYTLQEYVEGIDLARLVSESGPISVADALSTSASVAEALAEVHRAGLVHLDVKPANVVVPRVGARIDFSAPKLIDFGLTSRLQPSTGTTRAGMIMGTVHYMSPEQIRGEALSPATDVWGLGSLLFFMLFARPPFDADNLSAVLYKTIGEELALPPKPALPGPVREFILRCLTKNASERPRDPSTELRTLRDEVQAAPVATERELPPPAAHPAAAPAPSRVHESPTLSVSRDAAAEAVPTSRSAPRPSSSAAALWIGTAVLLGALVIAGVLARAATPSQVTWSRSDRLLGVLGGVGLMALGIGIGIGLRRLLRRRRTAIERDAGSLLLGTKGREALTRSIAIELDALIERCRDIDARILATSVAIMVQEYEIGRDSKDRQAALMNSVALLEKLMAKLSPWYVRHEKLLAAMVTSVGIASGIVQIVQSVLSHAPVKGGP